MLILGSVAAVSGEIGLWSKTDGTSYFKDYVVEAD